MRIHVFWDLQTWKHGHLCTSQRKRRRTCEYNFSSLWLDLQCNFLRSIPSICSEPATIALNLAETFHPCYHVGCCFAAACTVVQLSNHSRRWCWERQQVLHPKVPIKRKWHEKKYHVGNWITISIEYETIQKTCFIHKDNFPSMTNSMAILIRLISTKTLIPRPFSSIGLSSTR